MAKQTINIGTLANDGSGDSLRDAGQKINSNFTELYNTSGLDTTYTQNAFNVANTANTLAQSSFNKANTANTLAQSAFNKANTVLSDSTGVGLNIGSTAVVQLQYDDTGTFDIYNIQNGSWLYIDVNGLTFESNTSGTIKTVNINNDGALTFPSGNTLNIKSSPPTHSTGTTGDSIGMITFDESYFYYCFNNYDGSSHIWKRVAWSGSTW